MKNRCALGQGLITTCLLLACLAGSAGRTAAQPQADVMEVLTLLRDGGWYPQTRDPLWLAWKAVIEAELRRDPGSPAAALARQAIVRTEVLDSPVGSKGNTNISLDVRPLFTLDQPLPYAVDLYGSLDGTSWIRLASAYSGGHCGTWLHNLRWPTEVPRGFHHLSLIADVAYLEPAGHQIGCAFFTTRGSNPWSPPSPETIIARERRVLPGLSFHWLPPGALETPADQATPAQARDRFVQRLRATPVGNLEPGWPRMPLERWLTELTARFPDRTGDGVSWMAGYCNQREASWYRSDDEGFLPAASRGRERWRRICVDALRDLDGRVLHLRFVVAAVRGATGDWAHLRPQYYEGYLSDSVLLNELDIPSLGTLAARLRLPADQWPRPDISLTPNDIVVRPRQPAPGEPVTVTAHIRNYGNAEARHAHGTLVIAPCCQVDRTERIFVDYLDAIPAGETLAVEHTATFPQGIEWVAICTDLWSRGATGQRGVTYFDITFEDNCTGYELSR